MIAAKLASAVARRRALGLPSAETNAYRLVHGDADGLSGVTVDVYDRHLVASLYGEALDLPEAQLLEALASLEYDGVYLKRRPRQANELDAQERKERAPEHAVIGNDAAPAIVVHESGVPIEVRLGDGLSTGLFLDQRDNRARVLREVAGARVLNLFAYTCAFGAFAAVGGAVRTVNIDVAKSVLERGRRNYALSGLARESDLFFARDVLETLPRLARREERFDLVVLDPPSYASTKRGRFSVERDYPELVAQALRLVAEGGTMLACTNHHKLVETDLTRAVTRGALASSRRIRDLTLVSPPPDHPVLPGRAPHLKSAWIRL